VQITRDLSRWFFRAALGFEWTDLAVELAGAVEQRPTAVDGALVFNTLPLGQM
jgi:hypothetical protein